MYNTITKWGTNNAAGANHVDGKGQADELHQACTLSQRDPRWPDTGSVLGCERDLGKDESPGVEKKMGGRQQTTRRRWCAKP